MKLRDDEKPQGLSEQELVSKIREDVLLARELRRPYERQWLINMAFLSGQQYVFYNTAVGFLTPLAYKPGQQRIVDNKLLPRWRRQVSDMLITDPVMSVVPQTGRDKDIKAAKVGDKVLKAFWGSHRMKRKVRQLAGWIFATGNGFLSDRWDHSQGKPVLSKDGQVSFDEKTGKPVMEGDVECDAWSPFEVLVPYAGQGDMELQNFPWLAKEKWRSVEWIKDHYGVLALDVKPEPRSTRALATMESMLGLGGKPLASKEPEGVWLVDYYLKPCMEFPKGLFVTLAGDKIIQQEDYPLAEFPIAHFKDIDLPGVFWGKATLEEGITMQRVWNNTINSIHMHNRTMGRGKLLVPQGCGMNIVPDDQHGELIYYSPKLGYKPEQMDLKPLPATYGLILELTQSSMNDLFAQHEVSQGTNKSDIRSGEMVALLREQDAINSVPTHAVFEEALEEAMARVLRRMQLNYTQERTMKIYGKEGQFEVFSFQGADLSGNTEVTVKRQSSIPDSREARATRVLDRFVKGLYGDTADPEIRRQVMNMLEDGLVENIYGDDRLDEALARFENEVLMSGSQTLPLMNLYDNHEIHVREHDHYRKSLAYQRLKLEKPQEFLQHEMLFEAHTQEHKDKILEKMQRMMQMQGAGPA